MRFIEAIISKKLFKLLSVTAIGQGSAQLIQLIAGFLLIRWLSVEDYAIYSMAFAFQTTAQFLVEFGFANAIIAFVGQNINDKKLIGGYIKAGLHYRHRFFIFITIGVICTFPLIGFRQNWETLNIIFILFSIILYLAFSGWTSYYKPPLQIHGKISTIYWIEIISNILRLTLIGLMQLVFLTNSLFASFINTISVTLKGFLLKKEARKYIEIPKETPDSKKRELLNYLKPVMPGIIFAAFQSQISLFIISIFGNNESIAELGALGRIGQLFVFITSVSNLLIPPYIAKLPSNILKNKFILIITGGTIFSLLMGLTGFLFPMPFLILMGPHYKNLEIEIGLIILNASLIFLNGLFWNMTSARKWIYRWMPKVSIPGTLIIQILIITLSDLSLPINVIMLNLATTLFILLNRIAVVIYGLTNIKKE